MSPIHIDVNTNFLEAVGRLFLTIGDFSNEQKSVVKETKQCETQSKLNCR